MTATLTDTPPRGAELQIDTVSRIYGSGPPAVDAISLQARGGEILALLGPSGCGKTTTLRMIAGLVTPSSGDIRIDGQSVTRLPTHQRNLGMLFQNYALFPHLNVRENVAFGLGMRGVGKEEALARSNEALGLVQLDGYGDRMPAAMSGGQQQRVALARAIVYRPRLLLLDEPFGALDKKLRETMQIELRQLCNKLGLTTVLVTHDQEEALVLADQIAVMRGGRIEQVGPARTVYERPGNAFVAGFIGTSNFVPATLVGKQGAISTLRTDDGADWTSSVPTDLAAGAKALVAIRPESIRLVPVNAAHPDGNCATGIVTQSVFMGQHLSVWLTLPGEVHFVCTVPVEATGTVTPQPGEAWQAVWSPERTLIVHPQ